MKNILVAFCLICISTFVVFAQDSPNKADKDKITLNNKKSDVDTVSFTETKLKIDKVETSVIKDEKTIFPTLVTKEYAPKKTNNFTPRQNSGDNYNKNEFFVGYSYQNIDRGERRNFNGFNASYVRNVNRFVGVKGDFSGAYSNNSISFTNTVGNDTFTIRSERKNQLYNFLGGVQFKDNASEKKLKPFAHILAGAVHQRLELTATCSGNCNPTLSGVSNFSSTHFAGAFGGGLDVKINDKLDFRAVKFDYNPIFPGRSVVNNFRLGIGIVFK